MPTPPSAVIFAHLVTRGLDRAFEAAESVESGYGDLAITVRLKAGDEHLLEPSLDSLPTIECQVTAADGEHRVTESRSFGLDETRSAMKRHLTEAAKHVMRQINDDD